MACLQPLSSFLCIWLQRAHFLETDTELEDAHSLAATAGDTAVFVGKSLDSLSVTNCVLQFFVKGMNMIYLSGI